MGDKIAADGGKTQVPRGEQETQGNYTDGQWLDEPGGEGAIAGSEPVGIYRADSQGRDSGRRPRPVTHGKTLAFLIQSLADQIRESQEAQARESARQVRLEQQLQQLQAALDAWRASVADAGEDSTDVVDA
jgi:hypothetical protein